MLVEGPLPHQGRVLIYHREQWGKVCDVGWSDTEAEVVCRSLGFTGGHALNGEETLVLFGKTKLLRFWLNYVICKGTEPSLDMCIHRDWAEHDCDGEEAGVICGGR